MERHLVCCAAAVLMCAVPGIAAEHSPWRLTIKSTMLTLALSGDCAGGVAAMDTAQAEATRIWSHGDVGLRWVPPSQLPFASPKTDWLLVQCGTASLREASSEEDRLAAVASIRFLDGQPMNVITLNPHNATLLLKQEGREGRLANEQFPAMRKLRLGRMLGRALAHEIGHFLSASRAHTQRGLMRPTHSVAAFTGVSQEPFRISAEFRQLLSARRTSADLPDPSGSSPHESRQ